MKTFFQLVGVKRLLVLRLTQLGYPLFVFVLFADTLCFNFLQKYCQ